MVKTGTIIISVFFGITAIGQNIGIGTNTPNPNTLLDLRSETKGLLIPRVLLVALNNAAPFSNPPNSLLVFNTSFNSNITQGFYFWRFNKWSKLPDADEVWTTTGNADLTPGTHFIGTTDDISLSFRIRNVNSGNFTMTKLGSGPYEVTIPGENYSTADYVTLVTSAFITQAIATTF